MNVSTITVDVHLDSDKIPEKILWNATSSTAADKQTAKAMMLELWDGADKSALRIDLWNKEMMIDEMGDFIYQTMMGMADTFQRATNQSELTAEMKAFAKDFYKKFQATQMNDNKLV